MILWFLRLFPQFRELQNAYDLTIANYEKQSGVYGAKARIEGELSDARLELDKWKGRALQRESQWNEALKVAESLNSDLTECRSRLSELEAENLRLNDRLEASAEDRAKLWALVQESLSNERQAYQMRTNEYWQRQYGVIPHPDAPHIPENLGHVENGPSDFGRRGRLLPSEIVANAERDFWANHVKKAQERNQPKVQATPIGA